MNKEQTIAAGRAALRAMTMWVNLVYGYGYGLGDGYGYDFTPA
jgi:hypothetical protein